MHAPDHRRELRRAGLPVAVTAVAVLLFYLTMSGASERTLAFVQAGTGLVTVCAPIAAWLRRRRGFRSRPTAGTDAAGADAGTDAASTDAAGSGRTGSGLAGSDAGDLDPDLPAIADALAAALTGQWRRAATERRLRHPAPAAVRWRWPRRAVTGTIAEAVDGFLGHPPLPGLDRADVRRLSEGGLVDLLAVYGGVSSGRMVILGPPGSGKSGAAVLLLLDALEHRRRLAAQDRATVPVPVLTTLAGWDPHTEPFELWLAGRLLSDYPALVGGALGRDTARRLVHEGRIAVLLDGLDEIPAALHAPVVQSLNQQADCRLVLISRSTELADAVAAGHLMGAAAVELQPLSAASAADYLTRCRPYPPEPAWQRLIDQLRHGDSVVTRALTSPLMLSLVRDAFPDAEEIDRVLDPGRYRTAEDLADVLLDRVLTTAYQPQVGGPEPICTAEQARTWLAHLAWRMNREGTRDLAWWRVARWTPAPARVAVSTALFSTAFVPPAMFANGTVFGPVGAVCFGLVGNTVNGLALGLLCGRGGRRPAAFVNPSAGHLLTSAYGVVAVAIGLVVGVSAAHIGAVRDALSELPAARAGFGLAVGACFGACVLVTAALVARLRGRRPLAIAVGLLCALIVSAAFGAGLGLPSGLLVLVGLWTAHPVPCRPNGRGTAVDPTTCWRRERRYGVCLGLALAGCIGLTAVLTLAGRLGLGPALAFGTAVAAVDCVALAVMCPETWSAQLAFLQLWRAGLAPAGFMRFLDDARARNILRTVGPMYQFRHARLQDRLSTMYARTAGTPDPAPGPPPGPAPGPPSGLPGRSSTLPEPRREPGWDQANTK